MSTVGGASGAASETAALVAAWDAEGGFMTEAAFAKQLNVGPSTLRFWHREGIGPRRLQIGPRTVRYSKADAARWLAQLRQQAAAG